MPIYENQELSPKEWQLMEANKEERRETFEHSVTIKRLELELEKERNKAELDLRLAEAKWNSWLSIPRYILKLPVLFVLGLGYVVHAIRGSSPTADFWDFLRK